MTTIGNDCFSEVNNLVNNFLYSGADFCLVPSRLRLSISKNIPPVFTIGCSGKEDIGIDACGTYVYNFSPSLNLYYRVYKPNSWEVYHYFTRGLYESYGTPRGRVFAMEQSVTSLKNAIA